MSNTITAYFKGRIGVAESVYQNDYGIVMAFDSIDLPAHFDCYFSRLNQEEALPGLGADNRVAIPNSILANPGNVTIHIPLHTGENDSEVEYVVYFKVIGRARPIDDGTPTQMTAIEQALALLQNPITNIEEIVNEALSFTGTTFEEFREEMDGFKDDVSDDISDFKTEVRGDINDVETDFDNLEAQFNTAVAAVTTDTEVTNIRVGDDNVTYTTAGEAVRKQFSNVKELFNNNSFIGNAPYGKGGFTDTTCDENHVMPTNTDNTRLHIGPFQLNDDVVISVDSSIKYIFYSFYEYGDGTLRYMQWTSSFIQRPQIVGYNPDHSGKMYYYLLAAYDNNDVIANPQDILSKISVKSAAGKNPLHLVACSSWTVSNGVICPVNINVYVKNRCFGDFESAQSVKCTADVSFSIYKNGVEKAAAITNKPPLSGFFNMLIVDITLPDYSSFEELYDDIGFQAEAYIKNPIIGEKGVMGAPTNTAYDSETYKMTNLSNTKTRCLFGPLKVQDNIKIKANSGGRFILFALCINGQTAYNQVNASWQTNNMIIPVNPKYIDSVYYYLMVSKTDDSPLISAEEAEQLVNIEVAKGSNPLGIMFTNSWNSSGAPVGDNQSKLFRCLFNKHLDTKKYFYPGSDAVFSAKENGTETIQNRSGGAVLDSGNAVFLVRDKNSSNAFELFRTFEELSAFIGDNFESIDTQKLTGCIAFNDPITFLPNSLSAGEAFVQSMGDSVVFEGESIGFSHVPALCIDNGYAYVAFQSSTSETETDSTTSIYLAKYNLTSETYTLTKIAGSGTYGGLTFDGACTNPYMTIDSGTLYILFNAHINSGVALCCSEFNISAGTFTNSLCKISDGNTNYDFTVSNFNSKIGYNLGLKDMGYEIIVSVPQFDGVDTYYCGLSSGNWGYGKTAIIKTEDFENWEVFCTLPSDFGSDCEVALCLLDGYIYGACRHNYADATLRIWKLRISTKRIEQYIQIPDIAMRPTFYLKDDKLFLIHGLSSRKTIQVLHINVSFIGQSYDVITASIPDNFGYNAFADDGTDVYVASQIYTNAHNRIRINKVDFNA